MSAASRGGIADSAKDRTITRLAVLKAAAEFAANRPQIKSGEVVKFAASGGRWVTRPGVPVSFLQANRAGEGGSGDSRDEPW